MTSRAGFPALRRLAPLFLVLATACALVRPAPEPPPPLPPEAITAFSEAQLHLRSEDQYALHRARRDALRACRLAPRWAAPRRMIDDVDRALLLGPELLGRYEARLAREPHDAYALYLSGRLAPPAQAESRFRRAIKAEPDFAWGYHGLSWSLASSGDPRGAVRAEREALARARGSWERTYFTDSLSRHYESMGKDMQALEVCLRRLTEPDLSSIDRVTLGVRTALLELERPYGKPSRRGARRAIELLRIGGLTERETQELVVALMRTLDLGGDVTRSEIRAALRSVEGPGRDEMLALLLMQDSPSPLSMALLQRAFVDRPENLALNPAFRAARFAVGEVSAPIEDWLREQPAVILDSAGMPRDPGLLLVVERARKAERDRANPKRFGHSLSLLGDALVDAGWFEDAQGLAQELARYDVDRALEVDERASAGRALIESVVDVMDRIDANEPIPVDSDTTSVADLERADLTSLLDALEPRFQRYRDTIDEVRRGPRVELSGSPRLRYGSFGSVVHPGPLFSAEDESLGLGDEGDPVAGLAGELARIGRFGVFGEAMGGGGPDGTVLRRLLVEERSGEHLGTRWTGTIAWCDGADVLSRPGRRGARIGGAALHEGYWIDIGTLRREATHFEELRERFLETAKGTLARRALELRPLRRGEHYDPRTLPPLLGEADRVRLAILRDRAGEPEPGVSLDELVRATAAHEEGHLCDRTRFLPLSKRFLSVAKFFVQSGFSPRRVEERLEYRAQLTSLAATPEARLCLAEILAAAEQGTGGVTPHGAAYTRLLQDFVVELDRRVRANPEAWPELDVEAHLAHQLHLLGTEQVREIGLALADSEGLAD